MPSENSTDESRGGSAARTVAGPDNGDARRVDWRAHAADGNRPRRQDRGQRVRPVPGSALGETDCVVVGGGPYSGRVTQASTPTAPEHPDHIDAAVLKIAGVVVLGAIMTILDITVVNVALPTFQTAFTGIDDPLPYSTVAWTVTGYTLALATVIPLTGWAADRFGTKRLYLAAIGLFTLGSALCAAA